MHGTLAHDIEAMARGDRFGGHGFPSSPPPEIDGPLLLIASEKVLLAWGQLQRTIEHEYWAHDSEFKERAAAPPSATSEWAEVRVDARATRIVGEIHDRGRWRAVENAIREDVGVDLLLEI